MLDVQEKGTKASRELRAAMPGVNREHTHFPGSR